MHSHANAILGAYDGDPHATLSTTDLVAHVFPDRYAAIRRDLHSVDPGRARAAKRKKARLHRRLLHHINELIDRGVLRITDVQARGERRYTLAISSGELIIEDDDRTISIVKPSKAHDYARHWSEQGILFSRTAALHKVEAYAVNTAAYDDLWRLVDDVCHLYAHIGDCLGLLNIQHALRQDGALDALTRLLQDAQQHAVAVTLHLDLADGQGLATAEAFFEEFVRLDARRCYVIIAGPRAVLHSQHAGLSRIAGIFGERSVKLSMQCTDAAGEPLLLGHAGTYRLPTAWKDLLRTTRGLPVCAGSFTIDLGHSRLGARDIKNAALDATATLLARAEVQQRDAQHLLRGLSRMGPLWAQLERMDAMVRIWGADWTHHTPDLLSEIAEAIDRYCILESRIFAMAGVPLTFSTRLSSAFPHYAGGLSERRYAKHPVYGRKDLQKQRLELRERLCRAYDSDRVRLFREGDWRGSDLISEMLHILTTYDIPLLTYDFSTLQQRITLSHYLQ